MTGKTKTIWLIQRGDFEKNTHKYWSDGGWLRNWREARTFKTERAAMSMRRQIGDGIELMCKIWSDRHGTFCMVYK